MENRQNTTIYLDNAATTAIDPLVKLAMKPYLEGLYGNASMSYRLGNVSKVAIEQARRTISSLLHAEEGTILFTCGATEANNWAIRGLVEANDVLHVITSRLEHMSVLGTLRYLEKRGNIQVHFVPLNKEGGIVYEELAGLLQRYPKALVSLIHGNNEIGNITDIREVGQLCKQYGALFHTDMVQTVGYLPVHLASLPVDVCTASAHKFHGPKGIGFMYVRGGVPIVPLLYGGAQEKGLRAGTENVAGIVGLAKALSLSVDQQKSNYAHIQRLKQAFIAGLQQHIPGIIFHGQCLDRKRSLATIVNVGFPWEKYYETFLLQLDMEGISASTGSACMSSAQSHSHVLKALGITQKKPIVRFSFSKYNTLEEVQVVIKKMATQQAAIF